MIERSFTVIVYIVMGGRFGPVETAWSTPEKAIAAKHEYAREFRQAYQIVVRPIDCEAPTMESNEATARLRELEKQADENLRREQ